MEAQQNRYTPISDPAAPELPAAPDLERVVLGALLLEPKYIPDTAAIVEISTFSYANNSKIFSTLRTMSEKNEKIDLFTVVQHLKNRNELQAAGGPAYLSGLTSLVGSGANVLDHARQLRELDNRRRLILLGHELTARVNAGAVSSTELTEWMAGRLDELVTRSAHADDLKPISESVRETLEALERRQQTRLAGKCVGISTGLQELDTATGGWRGGQLIVLAGRPAMGKSAVMIHFAKTAAQSGIPVCIFSEEMPHQQVTGRILVGNSGISATAFRQGDITAEEWSSLEKAGSTLSEQPIHINDRANITMADIRLQCKTMNRHGKCGMVVIDYLQLLDTSKDGKSRSREREVAQMSRAAKMLAKELDIPVILLSQLNRDVESRPNKTPLLSDLRESGAIEQDADMVLFVHRPAVYREEEIETKYGRIPTGGIGLMIVAKNREGATGQIVFRHNDSLTTISDYTSQPANSGNGPDDENPF